MLWLGDHKCEETSWERDIVSLAGSIDLANVLNTPCTKILQYMLFRSYVMQFDVWLLHASWNFM